MCRCQRHSVPCGTSVEGARMSAEVSMGQIGMGDVDANVSGGRRQSRSDGDRFIARGVYKSWQRDFLPEDSKVKIWQGCSEAIDGYCVVRSTRNRQGDELGSCWRQTH